MNKISGQIRDITYLLYSLERKIFKKWELALESWSARNFEDVRYLKEIYDEVHYFYLSFEEIKERFENIKKNMEELENVEM